MNTWKKIIAGVLSAGLLLGCCGCGSADPEVTAPVMQESTPAPSVSDVQNTEQTTTSTTPPETTPPVTSTLPLPTETTPTVTPTLPLPTETTPPETVPVTTTPPVQIPIQNAPPIASVVPGSITSPSLLNLPNLAKAPQYPAQPKCPDPDRYDGDHYALQYAQQEWENQVYAEQVRSPENAHDLDPFFSTAVGQFLSGSSNRVCAPMNIYFALAMLAETTTGNSRQQILNRLGHHSIESLRAQANQLWRAHYYDNGKTTSLMANSLWLDQKYPFHSSTLDTLSTEYFASVFNGDLGTEDMDRQLAAWLNSQTGNLLSDYTQSIRLHPETVLALVSTAYFSADWQKTFTPSATKRELFYSNGSAFSTDFMHRTFTGHSYYVDPSFSAISLDLAHGHKMWLILPDEGFSPEDLLEQGDYYQLISSPNTWAEQGRYKVNLSMPKFDVSGEQDLTSGLKAMGITDVFDRNADFSPITDASVFVDEISHAARVAVDEEGVIAAAYTIIRGAGAAMPPKTEEVDFILNRPFLFLITGSDDLPLFAGTVYQP